MVIDEAPFVGFADDLAETVVPKQRENVKLHAIKS